MSQARLSLQEATHKKTRQLGDIVVTMPVHFASRDDYMKKLVELLAVEAECERLNTEMVAASSISYFFEERLEIYSRLQLQIPKRFNQFIREHAILSVFIKSSTDADYLGTGVIRKVKIRKNDPNLAVTLQIDIIFPFDRKLRQAVP